jgi:hypothetical protein
VHLRDVEAGLAEHLRELADHARPVLVGDAQPRPALARHARGREVDRVEHVAVLEEVAQLVDHHDRAVLLGLVRRGAQVRQR